MDEAACELRLVEARPSMGHAAERARGRDQTHSVFKCSLRSMPRWEWYGREASAHGLIDTGECPVKRMQWSRIKGRWHMTAQIAPIARAHRYPSTLGRIPCAMSSS